MAANEARRAHLHPGRAFLVAFTFAWAINFLYTCRPRGSRGAGGGKPQKQQLGWFPLLIEKLLMLPPANKNNRNQSVPGGESSSIPAGSRSKGVALDQTTLHLTDSVDGHKSGRFIRFSRLLCLFSSVLLVWPDGPPAD